MTRIIGLLVFIGLWKNSLSVKDTTFTLKHNSHLVSVDLRHPKTTAKGTILLLHGWNLPQKEWCEKTPLCSLALEFGYALVMPDFGKSTYHWEVFPETISRYKPYPTRKWMYEIFLPHLQKTFSLLLPGKRNFVAGLSTGGRGAALFALEHPEIFKGAACLSADFDQRQLKNEPINTGYYGPQEKFPERWSGKDNLFLRASEFKVPLILIHGKADKICPSSQSENFYRELKTKNTGLKCSLITDPTGGHNYSFWGGQSSAILRFFDEN